MSKDTFVSITTTVSTVAYICHKLTITLLFGPFHYDDALCALLPEVKADNSRLQFQICRQLCSKKGTD